MHSVTISSISAATYDYQLTNLFFLIYFQLSTLSILKKIHFFHLKSQYFLHISRPRFENSKSSLPSYKTTDTITLISCFIYHSNHFIIIKPCLLSGLPGDIIIIFLIIIKERDLEFCSLSHLYVPGVPYLSERTCFELLFCR